jgi:hypothetical protein
MLRRSFLQRMLGLVEVVGKIAEATKSKIISKLSF